MRNVIIKDVQGNTYTVEVADDFVLASISVEDVEAPVDENQVKDFEPVSVLSRRGNGEVREMSLEMHKELSELSSEIERDCVGLCTFKYRTNERYEKNSIKAWNKLVELRKYAEDHGWLSEYNDSMEDVIFSYATEVMFRKEGLDNSFDDWEPEVIQHSDAFQNAIRNVCKLLRMCKYSNSLSFEDRITVDQALSFGDCWVCPEIREEFNDLEWGW